MPARRSRDIPTPAFTRGFTLLEVAVVVAIAAVVVAVALPRLGGAGERARQHSLSLNTQIFQSAIDAYTHEHLGLGPAHFANGSIDTSTLRFVRRLVQPTTPQGDTGPGATLGPYLREIPINPQSRLAGVRIDGPSRPSNAGWRFDTTTGLISPVVPPEPVKTTGSPELGATQTEVGGVEGQLNGVEGSSLLDEGK